MIDSDGLRVKAIHPKFPEASFDLSKIALPLKYPQGQKLNATKLRDLQYLTQYMSQAEGHWIKELIEQQRSVTVQASVSEVVEGQEEIEYEEDDHDYDYDDHVRRIS